MHSFAAHMTQHMLLVAVAAPLLTVARPLLPLWLALSSSIRRKSAPLSRSRRMTELRIAVRRPALAWMLAALTLWAWHIPILFEAALQNEGLHAVEHVSLLASSLLLWSAAIGPRRVLDDVQSALYIFTAGLTGAILGTLITFSESIWYEAYAAGEVLSPYVDQTLAGLIMWIPTGVVYLSISLMLIYRWLRNMETRS